MYIVHTHGLVNVGNSCYMNAALQCIAHTPLFRQYFMGENRRGNGCITDHVRTLLKLMWQQDGNHSAMRKLIHDIKFSLGTVNGTNFVGNAQQCTVEFLDALFERVCNEDGDDTFNRLYHNGAVDDIQCHSHRCTNVSQSRREEPIIFLYMQQERPQKLQTLIKEKYTSDEIISRNCQDCSCQFATTKTKVYPASVMIFQIQRCLFGYKNNSHVDYPLSDMVLDESIFVGTVDERTYDLMAVACHVGSDTSQGHYYTFARGTDDCWRLYNDKKVSGPIPEREVVSKVVSNYAYTLYYQRRDISRLDNRGKCVCILFVFHC